MDQPDAPLPIQAEEKPIPPPLGGRLRRAAKGTIIYVGKLFGLGSVIGLLAWAYADYNRIQSYRETRLKEYLNLMKELMLDKNIYKVSETQAQVLWVARALTLNTLKTFDGLRVPGLGWQLFSDPSKKIDVLKFLYESHLIGYCVGTKDPASLELAIRPKPALISLKDASLSGLDFRRVADNLCGLDLSEATLTGASFANLDLRRASFERSKSVGVNFQGALLSNARMSRGDFQQTIFSGAELSGADFSGAQLCGATLMGISVDNMPETMLNGSSQFFYDRTTRFDAQVLQALSKHHQPTQCN